MTIGMESVTIGNYRISIDCIPAVVNIGATVDIYDVSISENMGGYYSRISSLTYNNKKAARRRFAYLKRRAAMGYCS